jgi:hypothetical protein
MLKPEHSEKQFQLRPSKTRIPGKENDGRSVRSSVPKRLGKSFGHSLNCSAKHSPGVASPSRRIAEAWHPARDLSGSHGMIFWSCSVQNGPIHHQRLNMSLKIHLLHGPANFVEVACKVAGGRPIERSRASSFDNFSTAIRSCSLYHSFGL